MTTGRAAASIADMGHGERVVLSRGAAACTAVMLLTAAVAACNSSTPASPQAPTTIASPAAAATPALAGTPAAAGTPATTATPALAGTPAPLTGAADPDLAAALAFVSDSAAQVLFTNWAKVLAGQSAASGADAAKVLLGLNKKRAMPASQLLSQVTRLRDTWKFDVFDLAWEADFSGQGQFSVLQFNDTFDLAPVVALLGDRGYTRGTDIGGGAIYTHPLDPTQPWIVHAPLLMLNVAVLAPEHRLVIGNSPDQLALALGTAGSTATPAQDSTAARALALGAALGPAYGAMLTVEKDACRSLSGRPTRPGPAASSDLSGVGPTLGTAIGFSAETGAPPVTVALLYPDSAAAQRDVAPRTALIGAVSARTGAPFSDSVMALSNVRAVGPLLLSDGSPHNGLSQLVVNSWLSRDLPFAACP